MKKFFALATAAACVMGGSLLTAPNALAQPAGVPEKITVGVHNQRPWGYRTPDGKVEGYNVEVIKAALEPTGIKIEFATTDFGSLIPGLLSNRYDIVDSSIVITPERCKIVLFSNPELLSKDAMLVLKGNPQKIHSYKDVAANPGFIVGSGRGSQQLKNVILGGVPESQTLGFQSSDQALAALLAGRIGGSVATSGTTNAMLTKELAEKVERATPFDTGKMPDGSPVVSYVSAAFGKNNAALRDLYNKRLAEIKKDGTVLKIMAKYGFTKEEAAGVELDSEKICAQHP